MTKTDHHPDPVFTPVGEAPRLRQKRSDQVAAEIKRWAAFKGLEPGQRLPKEHELADWFGCGRGTVREALKSLEVQGFVTVKTGPKGGAILKQPDYQRAADQLRSYLNYQKLTIEDLYQMRTLIEPAMAVAVVDVVDDALLQKLEASNTACESEADGANLDVRRRELDFHTVLAERCPNPLLGFQSQFINNLLREFIRFENPNDEMFDQFTRDNCQYHDDLIEAYRARDHDRVERLMREHMVSSHAHTVCLEGVMPTSLLVSPQKGKN